MVKRISCDKRLQNTYLTALYGSGSILKWLLLQAYGYSIGAGHAKTQAQIKRSKSTERKKEEERESKITEHYETNTQMN